MERDKTVKYLKYAIGEILLVVIGILIALQINNWNDHRRKRQKEIVYLAELKKGLESDLKGEFIPAGRIYKGRLESHEKLDKYYRNEEIYSNDSLSQFYYSCFSPEWDFVFNTATFENIKSAGIDIISNDTIRSKISSLYSYSYPNIREVNQNQIRFNDQQLTPIIYEILHLESRSFSPSELDFLKNNVHITNLLWRLKQNRSFLYERLIITIQQTIESLNKEIDLELKRLQPY
ncbi:DUF6090 family protein [Aegicerativicinus sediminis]|uniref:DUF6090 family protein n=1 Tax=Aegicerativicinus sediminis TaxID=2893202 RepID=UPI001E64EFCC|nr:DUF6090 family protein [Aegicerativicinus sediminis]